MTWNTDEGSRTVTGFEAQMIRALASQLMETIRACVDLDEPLNFGVPLFEAMTWQQQVVMVEKILKLLVDPIAHAEGSSALMDSTVAAFYAELYRSMEIETDTERLDVELGWSFDELPTRDWRQWVALVLDEVDYEGELPRIESTDMDDWDVPIQCLKGRVLADEDYLMESLALDLPPEKRFMLRDVMGIKNDYFIDVPPDVTTLQAQQAWARIVRRCEGRVVEPEFFP